jgi:hypothetical protein
MKPCPFCGSIQAKIVKEDPEWKFSDRRVICERCGGAGPIAACRGDAVAANVGARCKWDERDPARSQPFPVPTLKDY